MASACVCAANEDGTSANEKWHRKPFNLIGFQLSAPRRINEPRQNTMTGAARCQVLMVGLAHNDPNGIRLVRNLTTGEVVCRQVSSWYPEMDKNGVFSKEQSGGSGSKFSVGSGLQEFRSGNLHVV